MPKLCNAEGCYNPRWGKGYCQRHQYLREDKKDKSPEQRQLRVQSEKKAKGDRLYSHMRKKFLTENPVCQIRKDGVCSHKSTDVHHTKGRGIWYLIVESWMSVCRGCHDYAHGHPKEARDKGWIKSSTTKD